MKIQWKRSAVVVTVLMFVCAAVLGASVLIYTLNFVTPVYTAKATL